MTTRQEILAEVQTTLENILDTSDVQVFKYIGDSKSPIELDTIPLPAIFFYSDKEIRIENDDRAAIGKENWEWYITLEVWAQDKDMEELLSFIHTAMYTNYTLGHHAEWCERVGVDFFTIDPTAQLQAMVVPYKIIYRHVLGNM